MAINILTGLPREGKTLFAVLTIRDAMKLGNRNVYSNITDLKIDGVLVAPVDWNDVPDGSLVVYDEAQEVEDEFGFKPYAATGKSGFENDPRLKNLSLHGKRGIDLYFITQHPTFIHHQIRKLCKTHKHFVRTMGLNRSTIYTFHGTCCTSPDDRKERHIAEKKSWSFPSELFGLYKSADVHNVKVLIPAKVYFTAFIIIALIAGALYVTHKITTRSSDVKEDTEKGAVSKLVDNATSFTQAPQKTNYANQSLEQVVLAKQTAVISGCVSGLHCRCFDNEGFVLDLELSTCRNFAEGNLALPIKINFSKNQNSASPATITN